MMSWDLVSSEAEKGKNCANCSTVFDSNSKKAHKFLLSDNNGDPQKPILREITILEALSELYNLKSLSQLQCNELGSKTENTQTNSKFLSVRLCASCANLLAQLYKLYFDFNLLRSKSSFLEREIQRNLHTLTLKNKNSDNSDDNNISGNSSSSSNSNKKKCDQVKINNLLLNNNNNNNDRDTRTENMRGQIIMTPSQKIPASNLNSYHHYHHPPPSSSLLTNQQHHQQQHHDRMINNFNNNKATIIIQDTPKLPYSKPKSLIMTHYNNSNNNTDDDEGPIIVDCKSISQEQTKPNYNPAVPFLLHQALTSRSPSYSPKESKSNTNSSNESPIIRTSKVITPTLNAQDSTERNSNVIGMNLNRSSIVIQTRTVSELEITRITDRITEEISPPLPPTPRNMNNKVNNSSSSSSSSTSSTNQEHWRKRHCHTNFDSKNSKFSKIIIENPPNDNKTFKCGECRAVFDSFQQLSSHIQLHLPGAEQHYSEALVRKKSTERN